MVDISDPAVEGKFGTACKLKVTDFHKGIVITIRGGAVAGHATCYAMNKVTGEVNRQILRCGQIGSGVEFECGPVQAIKGVGCPVMVDAVECQCSGQSEGVCGGIGCDGNVLHLHGGVTGIAVTIGSDLCHTHSSRECQVDRCSDDQLGSVECKGITVQLGIGQCFDITLVSCDGEFSGSCQ